MKWQKFSFYLMFFLLFTIAVVVGVIYSRNNKKAFNKSGSNPEILIDKSSTVPGDIKPVQKVQINESDRIILTGTVDGLTLDADTGKYLLSMLLHLSDLNQQKILIELGSPKYKHLVRYGTPKEEKKTVEEVRSMDSIAPALIQGKTIQIEVSMNPEIEDFWRTYWDTNRNEVFKVVLPSVISVQM